MMTIEPQAAFSAFPAAIGWKFSTQPAGGVLAGVPCRPHFKDSAPKAWEEVLAAAGRAPYFRGLTPSLLLIQTQALCLVILHAALMNSKASMC